MKPAPCGGRSPQAGAASRRSAGRARGERHRVTPAAEERRPDARALGRHLVGQQADRLAAAQCADHLAHAGQRRRRGVKPRPGDAHHHGAATPFARRPVEHRDRSSCRGKRSAYACAVTSNIRVGVRRPMPRPSACASSMCCAPSQLHRRPIGASGGRSPGRDSSGSSSQFDPPRRAAMAGAPASATLVAKRRR